MVHSSRVFSASATGTQRLAAFTATVTLWNLESLPPMSESLPSTRGRCDELPMLNDQGQGQLSM